MTKLHEDVINIKNDLKAVKKLLEGNGKVGIVDVVFENRDFRIKQETKGKILKCAVGSGWAVTCLVLILTFFVNVINKP